MTNHKVMPEEMQEDYSEILGNRKRDLSYNPFEAKKESENPMTEIFVNNVQDISRFIERKLNQGYAINFDGFNKLETLNPETCEIENFEFVKIQ